MGCDIHLNAELFTQRRGQRRWVTIPGPTRRCRTCKGTKVVRGEPMRWGPCTSCEGTGRCREDWYEGRNYLLFSILADVRNGSGITPIADPRGLPEDVSKRSTSAIKGGDHSHSWLGLKEVIDWKGWDTQVISHTIWLDAKGYALFLAERDERDDAPKPGTYLNYQVSSFESGCVDLTNMEMESVAESGVYLPKHRTMIIVETALRTECQQFFKQTVKPLSDLARRRKYTDADVRLVFSFDN